MRHQHHSTPFHASLSLPRSLPNFSIFSVEDHGERIPCLARHQIYIMKSQCIHKNRSLSTGPCMICDPDPTSLSPGGQECRIPQTLAAMNPNIRFQAVFLQKNRTIYSNHITGSIVNQIRLDLLISFQGFKSFFAPFFKFPSPFSLFVPLLLDI